MAKSEELSLIEGHARAFNLGVRSGDWEPMLERFAPNATLSFAHASFSGIDAIRTAYHDQPPDDEIELLAVDGAEASFAWTKGGTGRMEFEFEGELVRALTIRFDEG